jgi:general secretion pathway protein M
MTLPTGIRGRLVAFTLVLIPLILLAQFVLRPLLESYVSTGNDLVSTREEIVHYQRLLGELPALQAAVARLERTGPLSPYLLAGTNRALAAAGLQKKLQDAATKHGVTILSLRVQNPASGGPLERISVQARLRAGIPELRDLLYWIETARPYLFIEDITVNARHARRRRTRTPGGLEVSLTLYGLRDNDGPVDMGSSNG